MKIPQTILKAFTRMNTFCLLLLTGQTLLAQENTINTDTTAAGTANAWYDQGWIWFVIIIVAIILILAFTRRSDKGSVGQNRYKDKR